MREPANPATAAFLRSVWVSEAVDRVPAHRITPRDVPIGDAAPAMFRIECPPFVAAGGVAITPTQARELKVFPCVRCFSIPLRAYAPPPPPPGRDRRW